MDFLSAAYFGETVTAAKKVSAATSYALLAVGLANAAYSSGPFEAYVSAGDYASGARPGYGFNVDGSYGAYLYATSGVELRLRSDTGLDYTLWHSGNARSDAQNDTRYSQLGHTHAIADVTGLQTAIDDKISRTSSGSDWNTTFNGAIFNTSATNGPAGVGVYHGLFIPHQGVTGHGTEIAFRNNNAYYRSKEAGVWLSWLQFADRTWVGTNYQVNLNTAMDWNLVNDTQIAKINTSPTNGPIAALAHGLHIPESSVRGTTLVFRNNTGYFRSMEGGTWNSWIQFADRTWVGANYVPTTRTLTINGTALDLSANRSWTVTNTLQQVLDAGNSATNQTISVNGLNATGYIARFGTNGGWIELMNASGTGNFLPLISGTNTGGTATAGLAFWGKGQDAYTSGAFHFSGRNAAGTGGLTTGNLLNLLNYMTSKFSIDWDGVVTAKGGTSTNWNSAFSWGNHASAGYALSSALSGYVPTTRTITINGTAFDLSADRSWTISGGIGGSGTAGFIPKLVTSATLGDSSIDDSDTNYVSFSKGINIKQSPLNWSITLEGGSSSNANIIFRNSAGTNVIYMAGSSTGLSYVVPGVGYVASFLTSKNLQLYGQVDSLVSTGTAPFIINSTTLNTNLNADMLDGLHASSFVQTGRTLTINGTTYDLSANRSWTIATSSTLQQVLDAGNAATNQTMSVTGPNANGYVARFGTNGGWIELMNASGTGNFLPLISGTNVGGTATAGLAFWGKGQDTYTSGAFHFSGRNAAGTGGLTSGNLLNLLNYMTSKFSVDWDGVITAKGGTSTNWNTAYGWGNHASAGYVSSTRTLTINGTTFDLSANRSWTISGTGTWNDSLSAGNVATVMPVITRSTATTSNDYIQFRPSDYGVGKPYLALSKSSIANKWEFYCYDGSTTTGAVNFAVTLTQYDVPIVDQNRTLTINGTTYNLSANRSWTISGFATPTDVSNGDAAVQSWVSANFATSSNLSTNYYTKATVDSLVSGLVSQSIAVNTTGSLAGGGNLGTSRTLSLVNDSGSPGANKLYGTNGSGVKGWYDQTSAGVTGSGTANMLTKWSSTGSITVVEMWEFDGKIFIGSAYNNRSLVVSGMANFKSVSQSERMSMTPETYGAMVYQYDGTEGLYMYKSSGWAYVG